jgi:hypothetical protein
MYFERPAGAVAAPSAVLGAIGSEWASPITAEDAMRFSVSEQPARRHGPVNG